MLVFPDSFRGEIFDALLDRVGNRSDWDLLIGCADGARGRHRSRVGSDEDFLPEPPGPGSNPPEIDNETRDLITNCERASGIAASRALLMAERNLGRALSLHAYRWVEFEHLQRYLRDNRLPRRAIAELFRFWNQTLRKFRPDGIVTGQTSSPQAFVMLLVASHLGIPVITVRASKICADRSYWTTDHLMFNERSHARYEVLQSESAPPSAAALTYLTEFRNSPSVIPFILRNWKRGEDLNLNRRLIHAAQSTAEHALFILRGRRGPKPLSVMGQVSDTLRRRFQPAWHRWRHFKRATPEELSYLRYVYLPLHKEPEVAINCQAPFWHDQAHLIRRLSASLPFDAELLVREHRFNLGRRPNGYYRDLERLPNVTVIDAMDDQFKYIANADLVITDNGSTGWEALILGRPVITLSRTFYEPTGLHRTLGRPDELPELLRAALDEGPAENTPERDAALARMYDAEHACSFDETPEGLDHVLSEVDAHVRCSGVQAGSDGMPRRIPK